MTQTCSCSSLTRSRCASAASDCHRTPTKQNCKQRTCNHPSPARLPLAAAFSNIQLLSPVAPRIELADGEGGIRSRVSKRNASRTRISLRPATPARPRLRYRSGGSAASALRIQPYSRKIESPNTLVSGSLFCGEGGIRTHGPVTRTPHFECGAFDHSATSPVRPL